MGCYWALLVLTLIKIIYGIRWVKKRTRNNFIKYYRLTITQILTILMYQLLSVYFLIRNDQRYQIYLVVMAAVQCVSQGVIMESHMRYLDKINEANNEL